MSKAMNIIGIVCLIVLGVFAGIGMFHTINDVMVATCNKPGIYIVSQDDTTITSCHDGQPQIWQKAMTVIVGGEEFEYQDRAILEEKE